MGQGEHDDADGGEEQTLRRRLAIEPDRQQEQDGETVHHARRAEVAPHVHREANVASQGLQFVLQRAAGLLADAGEQHRGQRRQATL
jgi:hypothetical protein